MISGNGERDVSVTSQRPSVAVPRGAARGLLDGTYPARRVFGIDVADVSMDEAIDFIARRIEGGPGKAHAVFFVNAHSLNVLWGDHEFRHALQRADCVFGDGTGVRLAVLALHGLRLRDNVNGTDLVPRMFAELGGHGFRYFLLGNTPERIERAAAEATRLFPGWELAGYHHGFVDAAQSAVAIEQINASGAHVLLVGMGNPLQEKWIARHLDQLRVPICMGTGGLFDYWAQEIERAPAWMRQFGCEWLYLLMQQRHKARRYVVGNPLFLARVAVRKWIDREGQPPHRR